MINLPELEIEQIPMTLLPDGTVEFASAGKEWFLWDCSLTIAVDPDDESEWKIESISLFQEDRVAQMKWRKRFLELKGPMLIKAAMYFAERHHFQISNHIAVHLPGIIEYAWHEEKEFCNG